MAKFELRGLTSETEIVCRILQLGNHDSHAHEAEGFVSAKSHLTADFFVRFCSPREDPNRRLLVAFSFDDKSSAWISAPLLTRLPLLFRVACQDGLLITAKRNVASVPGPQHTLPSVYKTAIQFGQFPLDLMFGP
jgi:hypothetical protein